MLDDRVVGHVQNLRVTKRVDLLFILAPERDNITFTNERPAAVEMRERVIAVPCCKRKIHPRSAAGLRDRRCREIRVTVDERQSVMSVLTKPEHRPEKNAAI